MSDDDLTALCNAINETLEAIEDWELQTRTGCTREEYRALHRRLASLLETRGGN